MKEGQGHSIDIHWLGCAGFKIAYDHSAILVDPYLSRNPHAVPEQPLTAEDFKGISHIFISHGHFDHLMDVPAIARASGARVVCTRAAAITLKREGLSSSQIIEITPRQRRVFAGRITAQAFESRHVRFDLSLVISTFMRMGRAIPKSLPLFRYYPCGQVLGWEFQFSGSGRKILFFGSAGSGKKELRELAQRKADIILIPLQGHSKICAIGMDYVRMLGPEMVIPHHWDDFYPPLSRTVDIDPFVQAVSKTCPGVQVIVPGMNEKMSPFG